MRSGKRAVAWVACGALVVSVLGVAGCGGGGSGGGGGLPQFLVMGAGFIFGNTDGGQTTQTPYPTLPANGVPVPMNGTQSVAAPVFPSSNPGSQDFVELSFNVQVDATTVKSSPPSGQDGIVLLDDTGTPVPFLLDETGMLDPANAFPAPGATPPVVRLYYDTDGMLSTPENFVPGSYTLQITGNLRSFNGGPFCAGDQGSENCINNYLPRLPFTVGNDMDFPDVPLVGVSPAPGATSVSINSEIVINFDDAVDFLALVGGAANVTLQDPFVSIPYPAQELACMGGSGVPIPTFTNTGNLNVLYQPPTDPQSMVQDTLPPNLGYLVYMPDPLRNPTQVRVRFVDISNLDPGVGPGTTGVQNYASSRRFGIPGAGGGMLQLPPAQPVPGSAQGATGGPGDLLTASVSVVVHSANFQLMSPPFPAPPDDQCYMGGGGAADRSGNAVQNDVSWTFFYSVGPGVARNPVAPDGTVVISTQGNTRGLSVVNTADFTERVGGFDTAVPVTYGASIVGNISLAANPLQNLQVLGTPLDVELGAFLQGGVADALNNISNPPRGNTIVPGTPDSQNGIPPLGVAEIVGFCMMCPPIQPLGNYLYVVDGDAGVVKVFDSYNFSLMTSLVGIPSPRGLGIAPNLEFLYVSNFNNGTVTKVFSNPASNSFHTVSNVIPVGAGPSAVSVQPSNEDVFVANFSENTYSIVDTGLNMERVRLSSGFGPTDIFITHRMNGMNLTNAYTAHVTNFFDDTVTIYESDSFAVPENGPEGRQVAQPGGFASPGQGCWNWHTYIGGTNEPGIFVANSQGNTVDELTLFNFVLSPPPGFPGPPGRRDFHIRKSYNVFGIQGVNNEAPTDATIDAHSGGPNIFATGGSNNKGLADPVFSGSGTSPSVVLISIPGAALVAAVDYNSPTVFTTLSVPGADKLHSYYDQ